MGGGARGAFTRARSRGRVPGTAPKDQRKRDKFWAVPGTQMVALPIYFAPLRQRMQELLNIVIIIRPYSDLTF